MTDLQERVALFVGLGIVLLFIPYIAIQYYPLYPATMLSLSAIDHWIPFFAPAIWTYLLYYGFIALPLFVVRDRRELRDIAFGFAWITVVSHIIFLMWPTEVPALDSTAAAYPMLQKVLSVDTNRNAFPSLHASLALYCTACCMPSIRTRSLRYAMWLVALVILASCLLARRHVIIDLLGGAALAWIAWRALFRPAPDDSRDCEALRATIEVREGLAHAIEPNLSPLRRHEAGKRALEVAFFVLLAAGGVTLTLTAHTALATAAGIALTAVAINAFVLLMHEGMHGVLLPNPRLNWLLSVLLGSTFLMSFSAYRVMHIRHHNYLGDARDPDDYHNYARSRPVVWALHFVRLLFGSPLYLFLIPVLALKYGELGDRKRILAEYAILLAIYSIALRIAGPHAVFLAWFVPLLIVGLLVAIRGFSQHGITEAADPYLASRTMLPHPAIAFLLLNENYHLEHHLFPEVPSYHLPRLHQLIWPRLPRAVSGRGYLRFLASFLKATPRMDETPIGLVRPGTDKR